jgi:hypothetical protein
MTEINIASAIDELLIFDDPDYCGLENKHQCVRFEHYIPEHMTMNTEGFCHLFLNLDMQATELEYDGDSKDFIKCDQCKASYQKAILNRSPFNSKPDDSLKNYKPEHSKIEWMDE